MEFKAYKMDGLGNDFVIIDRRKNDVNLSKEEIIKILDNKLFIGDQNNVTLASSFFCLTVSVEGPKSKNTSWLIQPLLAFR